MPGLAAGLGPGWAGSPSLGAQAHPGTPRSGSPAPACEFSCRGGCRHSGSCSCTQHGGRWQSHEAQTTMRRPARHRPLWLPSPGCAATHAKAPPPHQGCGRRCPSREKRLSEAQRRSGEGGSHIQKARKEHKFKAVQKDKMAESMSLFLGGPSTSHKSRTILQAELVMQEWCVFEGNRDLGRLATY